MLVVDKKRVTTILGVLIGFSLVIGFLSGIVMANTGGPRTEEDFMNSANEIEEFIHQEVEKNINLEEISKQAEKMGKRNGLMVAFIIRTNQPVRVNIMVNLGNKSPRIKSFEI